MASRTVLPEANGSDEVMTPREVAQYLKLPLSTVYKLTQEGRLRGVKLGKHWRYLASDVRRQVGDQIAMAMSPPVGADRRRDPRIDCHVPCQFSVEVPERKHCRGAGAIANLSRAGALVTVEELVVKGQLVAPGDPIELEMPVGPLAGSPLQARVARIAEGERPAYGIEFAPLSAEVDGKLQAWLANISP